MTQPARGRTTVQPITDEARYRPVFAAQHRSPALRDIWAQAYGSDYPAELSPLNFITRSDLALLGEWLAVGEGDAFADLGCGRGGPGLWLARESGARVHGVDIAPEAVAEASLFAAELGLAGRAEFQVGSFAASGLPGGVFQAALSIDSLWMVLDKPSAIREVGRLLEPGGRWAITTWEPGYFSYARVLADAGWTVEHCVEPEGWRERQTAVYAGILTKQNLLIEELGLEAADVLITEAREAAPVLASCRRLYIAARR